MMRLDARRLVRAVGLVLLLFLLVGGGAGFVMAAGAPDDLRVPAPRPGDRAVYSVTEVVFDPGQVNGDRVPLDRVVYEWLPEVTVLDRDFRARLAHPLRIEYVYDSGTPYELHVVQEVHYDAGTGEALYRSRHEGTSFTHGTLVMANGGGPFVSRVTNDARTDVYNGQIAPCGIVNPLQGAAFDGGDLELAGACAWPGGKDPLTYSPDGWEATPVGRGHAFTEASAPMLRLWADNDSPFPLRVSQAMGDFFKDAYTRGRLWDLQRIEAQRGLTQYTPVPAEKGPAATVPLVPRTPWIIDDAGLDIALPLPAAYSAALAKPTSAADGQAGAGDWTQQHPDGYLAFAMRLETVDRHGQAIPSWLLLWVDGNDWLGKQVSQEPPTVPQVGLTLPSGDMRQVEVRDWTPGWLPGDRQAYFPRLDQLPASIPSATGLVERYVAAHGADAPANRYGFEIVCRGVGCNDPAVYVEAGSHTQEQSDLVDTYEAGVETSQFLLDKMRVTKDGRLALRTALVESEQGTFAPFVPAPSQPVAAGGAKAPTGAVWVPPVAPAAATGIGLLAVLGGVLYYFWPAVKGGVAGLGLFSRIDDDKLLDHPLRRRIHDAIAAEPGIHFQALVRKTGLVRGNVEHHLGKLVAGGLVITRKAPGYTCHFLKGAVDRHVADAAPALRSEGSRAVLQALAANPGATGRDLAAQLGIAPSTVSYHLRRLESAGLVFGVGAAAGARLSPLGEQAAAS